MCVKQLRGCNIRCLHKQMVEEYRAAREAYEDRMEQETALYTAEVEEWKANNPSLTFKSWLQNRGAQYV